MMAIQVPATPESVSLNVPIEEVFRPRYCYFTVQPCVAEIDEDGVKNIGRPEEGQEPEFYGIYGMEHQEDGTHLPINIADGAFLSETELFCNKLNNINIMIKLFFAGL